MQVTIIFDLSQNDLYPHQLQKHNLLSVNVFCLNLSKILQLIFLPTCSTPLGPAPLHGIPLGPSPFYVLR